MRDQLRKKAGGESIIISISLTSGMVGETSNAAYIAIKLVAHPVETGG